jgi:hypothetical protein
MYKHKYLKYKFKYLQLTKQFGGECDTETQQDEVDPVFFLPLKSFKPEERITLGKKDGNPGICMLVKSAFYTNILAENKFILGTQILIEENEKIIIKKKFKELYFKIIRFNPAGDPKTSEMAVCINNLQMIPFNGYYQQFEIPTKFSLVENIEPYHIGCLVIIRRLINFLDPPQQGTVAGSTYNTKTMNGSLGVIVGFDVDDRYQILILAPYSKIELFKERHPDTSPTTQEEINDYYRKYGKKGVYITKRLLIAIKREKLDLL